MERNADLANRLREVLLTGYLIANTNFKIQLESIDWNLATSKVGFLNTIAELTFHVNYFIKGLIEAFEFSQLTIRDKYSFDVPPINPQDDWEILVNEFLYNSEKFLETVGSMEDQKLDETFVAEKYGTNHRNIEGIIEHTYYHLGQVVIIKKLVAENVGLS